MSTSTMTMINKTKRVNSGRSSKMSMNSNQSKIDENSKDYEIKQLKEEILRLKVKNQDMENGNLSMIAMGKIRESIKMADQFIKANMKDCIFNYDLVVDMENEIKDNTQRVSKEEKKKLFKSSVENMMKPDNCICSYCMLRNNNLGYKANEKNCQKLVQASSSFFLKTDYCPSKFDFSSSRKGDKNKLLVFKNRDSKRSDISIELIHRSQDVECNYDFSMHAEDGIETESNEQIIKVSMSSFLVVKAMREVKDDQYSSLMESETIFNNPNKSLSCMDEFMNTLEDEALRVEGIHKISDLTEQQEMWFLTRYGNRKCYIRVDDQNRRSDYNHIEWNSFKNSVEVDCYKLSTSLLRNISFFMDMNKEEEEMSDFEIMVSDRKMSSSSSNDSFGELKWTEYKCDMTKAMYANQGDRRDSFFLKNFYNLHKSEEISGEELGLLLDSDLHWNFIDRFNHPDFQLMRLFYMSRRAFLTILYFTSNTPKFTHMVYDETFNNWGDCMLECKDLIRYYFLYRNNEDNLNVSHVYRKFEKELFQNKLINNDFTHRLYKDFKERVFKCIKMYTEAANLKHREAEISNMMDKDVNSRSLESERFLAKLRSEMRKQDNPDIWEFSPVDYLPDYMEPDLFLYSFRNEDIKEVDYMANKFSELFSKQY